MVSRRKHGSGEEQEGVIFYFVFSIYYRNRSYIPQWRSTYNNVVMDMGQHYFY